MTGPALRDDRKTSAFARFSIFVTCSALQFQRGMLPVVKGLIRAQQIQGKEKASKVSEYLSLYLFPPPAATTTYCLLVFFE